MLFFKGVEHSDFTDSLFAPSFKTYIKHWSRTSQKRLDLWRLQADYHIAFFGRYLSGDTTSGGLLDARDQPAGVRVLRPGR